MGKCKKWLETAKEENVTHNTPPEELRAAVDLSIPKQGAGLQGALDGIDTFLEHSVRTHHPAYIN